MKRYFRLLLIPALLLSLAAPLLSRATADSSVPANKILAHALDIELGRIQPKKYEQRLSSGVVYGLLQAKGV